MQATSVAFSEYCTGAHYEEYKLQQSKPQAVIKSKLKNADLVESVSSLL